MRHCLFLLLAALLNFLSAAGQDMVRWAPDTSSIPAIEGQAWPREVAEPYARFPARAQQDVSRNVWELSRNSAGLLIRFYTNAPQVSVRYLVSRGREFPHMPATGVSGVDLYGKDRDGKWMWFPGQYSFADTITYSFSNLLSHGDTSSRRYEYRLYLPLYNTLTWMEFSHPAKRQFTPAGVRREKPIVVYGTSIAQGGCASRPGLAWTAILERNLDRPLINLGFSGNGILDSSIIDLMTEIDAKAFVLDCLPNLVDPKFTDGEIAGRLNYAVTTLRKKRPAAPIILSEHSAGNKAANINLPADNRYSHVNRLLRQFFTDIKKRGMQNIHYLSTDDIGLPSGATVDGVHPTDLGMDVNARAYETLLRQVLHEEAGKPVTTIPVSQSRDEFYFFPERHQEVIALNREMKPATVFIGNSIVHMWGGQPGSSIVNGQSSWDSLLAGRKTVNMGFGWDRVENVLWRVHHDELDGFKPKTIIVMIGTNNIGLNTDEEIVTGLKHLYTAVRHRQPQSRLLILGILPRTGEENRVRMLNTKIAQLATTFKATFANPGKVLLDSSGKTNESLFFDGLHPNEEGYKKLAARIGRILQ